MSIVGYILFRLHIIVDMSDGDVARFNQNFSIRGAYWDAMIHSVLNPLYYISICFSFLGNSYLSNFDNFKKLKELQILIPKNNHHYREWVEDDDWHRNYLFFEVEKTELQKILFGIFANEVGR